ncbi:hypothetical protein AVEN_27190-1 [Araneus ventricosus]|uniref:Uncharacterized protein n=1 Tax=Araneus ventricosus TaxID=182803 RepID=A0A4Y2FHQ4_ARAVE|nr:hypothetical protein AVEN_27190-1 [Araneus ventricosus]
MTQESRLNTMVVESFDNAEEWFHSNYITQEGRLNIMFVESFDNAEEWFHSNYMTQEGRLNTMVVESFDDAEECFHSNYITQEGRLNTLRYGSFIHSLPTPNQSAKIGLRLYMTRRERFSFYYVQSKLLTTPKHWWTKIHRNKFKNLIRKAKSMLPQLNQPKTAERRYTKCQGAETTAVDKLPPNNS